jgi:hypothetical protein
MVSSPAVGVACSKRMLTILVLCLLVVMWNLLCHRMVSISFVTYAGGKALGKNGQKFVKTAEL